MIDPADTLVRDRVRVLAAHEDRYCGNDRLFRPMYVGRVGILHHVHISPRSTRYCVLFPDGYVVAYDGDELERVADPPSARVVRR